MSKSQVVPPARKPRLVCPGCGRTIAIRGEVWRHRALYAHYDEHGVSRDFYCDICADKREMGIDF